MTSSMAVIYKKGVRAATLEKQGGLTKFQYETDYLFSGKPAVASTLPPTGEPIYLANGAAPAFFSGLLPEGRRLGAIVNRLKTSPDDDLSLLLEIGSDLIGDVQVLKPGVDPHLSRDLLMLPKDAAGVAFDELRDEYFGARATGLPGVQDKISSKMLNARARMANVDYILKLNPVDAPFAVQNESYFLGLAKTCDIKTANFKVLTDKKGDRALLLERFDRVASKSGTARLAQEDGCQVMNLYPAEKYNVDFLDMAGALLKLCPAKGVAGFAMFKQIVFSWLIGNGDAHAKNFSVLESESGEWLVSPAYDLLCTRFYEERGDRDMALRLNGISAGWNRKFLLEAALALRVPGLAAEKIIDKQLAALADLPGQILEGALPFRRDQNYEVADFLKQRARALS